MASLTSAPLLPEPGKSKPQKILTVLSGQIYSTDDVAASMKDKIKNTFANDLHDYEPETVVITDVERGEYNVDGTLTDIYNIANEARRIGWSTLVVVDALSVRQMLKSTRWGENRSLTAIVVDLKCKEDDQKPHDTKVFIRRLPFVEAFHQATDTAPKKWSEMVYRVGGSRHFTLSQKIAQGTYLADPYGSPFIDDNLRRQAQTVTQKALDNSEPALPNEIKLLIKNDIQTESPISSLTDAPAEGEKKKGCLRLQSLIHLTTEQIQAVAEKVKHCAKPRWPESGKVEIHQWKPFIPCNRRDLIRLYKRYLDANEDGNIYGFIVACSEPSDDNQVTVRVGWASAEHHQQYLLVTGSVDEFVERWHFSSRESLTPAPEIFNQDKELPEGPSVEKLFDPVNAYPPDTPLWKMPDHSVDDDGISAPPVYYLTKNLSEEEKKAIVKALAEEGESDDTYNIVEGENGGKQYCFVPWNKEEDGTVEDMLQLLWNMRNHRGGRDQPHECIFVDKQTALDSTVILADARWVGHGLWSGMEYGRMVGKDASIAWINLDVANMGIEDFVNGDSGEWNELMFFKDPEYDGPLTYEEFENQQGDSEAEGSTGEEERRSIHPSSDDGSDHVDDDNN